MMTRKTVLNIKVKGGVLYISIIISVIIGVLLSMFILLSRYNQQNITVYSQSSQLYFNLNSAFEIVKSEYFRQEENDKWFKNISSDDSIKIKKMSWGAYILVVAETKNRHQSLYKSGLFGTYLSSDTGLVISDNGRPVGMSGNIVLKSNCYLPAAGIKPAFIEGQSYQPSAENAAHIKVGSMAIPVIDKMYLSSLKEQQNTVNFSDSILGAAPQHLNNPFNKKTISIPVSGTVNNLELRGNIKISGDNITVSSSNQLDNILIVCRKVRFAEGFKGRVHVIATDSIIAEKDCVFNYPSSFIINGSDNSTSLKTIQLNENCIFYGGIIALNEHETEDNSKVFIKLHAKSEVGGLIYSADYVHLEGKIFGTVIANNLLLKTPSAVYENHLLGCEIDTKRYSHAIGVPMLFNKSKLLCCQTL